MYNTLTGLAFIQARLLRQLYSHHHAHNYIHTAITPPSQPPSPSHHHIHNYIHTTNNTHAMQTISIHLTVQTRQSWLTHTHTTKDLINRKLTHRATSSMLCASSWRKKARDYGKHRCEQAKSKAKVTSLYMPQGASEWKLEKSLEKAA